MGRRAIPIEKIVSYQKRMITYKKRSQGLWKKARELSILCERDIHILFGNPHSHEVEVCPSLGEKFTIDRNSSIFLNEMMRSEGTSTKDRNSLVHDRRSSIQNELHLVMQNAIRFRTSLQSFSTIFHILEDHYGLFNDEWLQKRGATNIMAPAQAADSLTMTIQSLKERQAGLMEDMRDL